MLESGYHLVAREQVRPSGRVGQIGQVGMQGHRGGRAVVAPCVRVSVSVVRSSGTTSRKSQGDTAYHGQCQGQMFWIIISYYVYI